MSITMMVDVHNNSVIVSASGYWISSLREPKTDKLISHFCAGQMIINVLIANHKRMTATLEFEDQKTKRPKDQKTKRQKDKKT